ncbi:LacI-family regulatory protein [Reinekea sp. MED297]|uniref:LacI-family regulatory protein n=2 Tax=Reinekea TaxID=230494 RepID=A4BFC7_9GAMM|nr:LacI-family regulatory protein [Reinekea sp. MED297] [Reinekea blandensis MED297]
MLDIATAVGVSQPTVSVILNGSDTVRVSEETRQRVLQKAQDLGYQFRSVQHSYRHPRIALVVNSLNMHDPFINAISSAKARAWERDAVLSVFDYEDNDDLKRAIYDVIEVTRFDGVIYARNTPTELAMAEVCPAANRVLLNCFDPTDSQALALLPADGMGGYRACEHLISHGHRRIGMITGEPWSLSSKSREQGYRQAMTQHNLPVDDRWVIPGNWSVKQAYLATEQLLDSDPDMDAIFCASDLMALGVYQALQGRGLRIPQDIALIGYDNQLLANELTPSLSSVELPYDEMGRLAVDEILDQSPPELPIIRVEGDVIHRESSRVKTLANA